MNSIIFVYIITLIAAISAIAALIITLRKRGEKLSQVQNEYNHVEQASAGIVRSNYFSHILAGNYYPDAASLFEEGTRIGVDFSASRLAVVSIKIEKWGGVFASESGVVEAGAIRHIFFVVDNVVSDMFAKVGKVFGAEFLGRHLCIVGLKDDITEPVKELKDIALEAIEFLEKTFDLSITVAISRVYNDAMKLDAALGDTANVFEYIEMSDDDAQVTAFDDFDQDALPMNESDFLDLESKLLSCIRASDFEGARHVVYDMAAKELFDVKPSIQVFKFRVYGLVNTLLHMTEAIRQTIGDEIYYELDPGHKLCDAGSVSKIMESIDEMFDRLLEFSEEKKKDTPPPWVALVRNYVDENYRDFNLTVSSVSDKFNISPSYCSRIFKQHSGIGLFEYIQRKRMDAAKALMNTNMSVKSIAKDVGFSSSLTMNRAFKRYEGTTPSKFKENW